MRVKFWGVRGSLPAPERRNSRYGGNTPCIEVQLENGTVLILDGGSGLRPLGKSLFRRFGDRPIQACIFLTHFHWDHIQGIPFFLPLYRKGNKFLFYSALVSTGPKLQDVITGQMGKPYFPVDTSSMEAVGNFYGHDDFCIEIAGARVSSAPLNHPQGCVGYRIEADGAVLVLATDTEPGSPRHDRSVRELARGADVLIYDAQYTPEQLHGPRKGWGHSCWREGTLIARASEVKELLLYHHDPESDDAFVDSLVNKARNEFSRVIGAAEGLEITLARGEVGLTQERRREHRYSLALPMRLRWGRQGSGASEPQGFLQDVSRAGIYFETTADLSIGEPVEVEVVLPDEITRRGDTPLHFVAEPVRLERLEGTTPSFGIGARIAVLEGNSR